MTTPNLNEQYSVSVQSSLFNLKESFNQFLKDLSRTEFINLAINSKMILSTGSISGGDYQPTSWIVNNPISGLSYSVLPNKVQFTFSQITTTLSQNSPPLKPFSDYTVIIVANPEVGKSFNLTATSLTNNGVSAVNNIIIDDAIPTSAAALVFTHVVSASSDTPDTFKRILRFSTSNYTDSVLELKISPVVSGSQLDFYRIYLYKGALEVEGFQDEYANIQIISSTATLAETATRLETPRSIAVSGAAIGSAMFDGSTNILINTTLKNISISPTTNWVGINYANLTNSYSSSPIFEVNGNTEIGGKVSSQSGLIFSNVETLPSSTATPNGMFGIKSAISDVRLDFGVSVTNLCSWIQSRHDTIATFYNLSLNSRGGKVIVGTHVPVGLGILEVNGDTYSSGNLLIGNGSVGTGTITSNVNASTSMNIALKQNSFNFLNISRNASTYSEFASTNAYLFKIGANNKLFIDTAITYSYNQFALKGTLTPQLTLDSDGGGVSRIEFIDSTIGGAINLRISGNKTLNSSEIYYSNTLSITHATDGVNTFFANNWIGIGTPTRVSLNGSVNPKLECAGPAIFSGTGVVSDTGAADNFTIQLLEPSTRKPAIHFVCKTSPTSEARLYLDNTSTSISRLVFDSLNANKAKQFVIRNATNSADAIVLGSDGSFTVTSINATNLNNNGGIGSSVRTGGSVSFERSTMASEYKVWDIYSDPSNGSTLSLRAISDSNTNANAGLVLTRTGYTISRVAFNVGSGTEKVSLRSDNVFYLSDNAGLSNTYGTKRFLIDNNTHNGYPAVTILDGNLSALNFYTGTKTNGSAIPFTLDSTYCTIQSQFANLSIVCGVSEEARFTTGSGLLITNGLSVIGAFAATGAIQTDSTIKSKSFMYPGDGSAIQSSYFFKSNAGGLETNGTFSASGAIYASAFYSTSSIRYKTNVIPLIGSLDRISKLQGVSYNLKSDNSSQIGLIAENVYDVIPEVVNLDSNGNPDSINYSALVAELIESIKELKREIEILKSK